ncbi:MAG: hypothetical protein IJM63_04475 [Solobacterium sp.]|nr:hypothetical protein [Solobacterium sp.]
MKKNIVTAVFTADAEAYKALSDFRRDPLNSDYQIYNAAIVKKNGESLSVLDGFGTGAGMKNYSFKGWIIGMLTGFFGGIFTMMMGGCLGSLIGYFFDAKESRQNSSMIQESALTLPDNLTALIILVNENGEAAINERLAAYDLMLSRYDADEMLEKALAKEQQRKENARQAKKERMSSFFKGHPVNLNS